MYPSVQFHADTGDSVPSQVPAWDWLFESSTLATFRAHPDAIKGFTNTVTKERITHRQIRDLSTYVSSALTKIHGLKEGDVVSICSPNSVWFPVAMFGVMRAGGIAALSSPAYTEDEMVHVLGTVKCKFIMTSAGALEVVKKAARRLGISDESIFILDGDIGGFQSLQEMIEAGRKFGVGGQVKPFKLPTGKKGSEVCALLCFSSGTTGLPKAVC
jgi:4-coumarate--CoA ligase